jgi:predicted RNA-binding Zn-ribbon protein involved in translation (DUF1610 family)
VARVPGKGRIRFEVADIVRRHRAELEQVIELAGAQKRVLSAIAMCRTAALGGHLDVCTSCGDKQPAYNSCRDRHCPKCQSLAQERWIHARSMRILPTPHWHVVFTLPSQLRALAKYQPKAIYDALFHAASDSLLELGRSRLGAELGITTVLHTWTRELKFHPHLHAIVSAGGLSLGGDRWMAAGRNYLFPVLVLGQLLRGKMLASLRELRRRGQFDGFDEFQDPQRFDELMSSLARQPWNTYAKKPFRRADHVLRYLGRYTHRVGISNSRLLEVSDQHVTFATKNGNTTTVSPVEFLRRFVQHVLPPNFVKIRHYGLLAGRNVDGKLERARELLRATRPVIATDSRIQPSCYEHLRVLTGRNVHVCRRCGGVVEHRPLPTPQSRSPPAA